MLTIVIAGSFDTLTAVYVDKGLFSHLIGVSMKLRSSGLLKLGDFCLFSLLVIYSVTFTLPFSNFFSQLGYLFVR